MGRWRQRGLRAAAGWLVFFAAWAGQDGALELEWAWLTSSQATAELRLEREEVFVGELHRVELVLELDRGALEREWVLPYQRAGSLPIELRLPWLRDLEGLRRPSSVGAPSLLINGELWPLSLCEQSSAPTIRSRYALRLEWIAARPGAFELTRGSLHTYRTAATGASDFLGRPPRLEQELRLALSDVKGVVRALPEAGRPADFSGAVGDFTLEAAVSTRVIQPQAKLSLELGITGSGTWPAPSAPRIEPLPGLRVLSSSELPDPSGRRFLYELEVLERPPERLEALEWSYFDPRDGGSYRRAKSATIDFSLATTAPPAANPSEPSVRDRRPRTESRSLFRALAVAALAALVLGLARRAARRRSPREKAR